MKRFTTAAFAALLASGALVQPAFAKDKQEEAPPPFKYSSAEMVQAVGAAQTALQGQDVAAIEAAVAQVEARVQNDDDRYAAAALRAALEGRKAKAAGAGANRTALVRPYTTLLNHPKTPPGERANFALDLGIIYYNSKQFKEAAAYFQQAQQLGATDPNLSANIVRAKMLAGDATGSLSELETLVQQQTAQRGKADQELYRFALSRTIQAKDGTATLNWMRRYLTAYPTAKNWRDMIKIYGLQQGSFITPSKAQSLDLYRLMRATGSLADQYDYEYYAATANGLGLPWEAKAVITEGRAKGKIPAGGSSAQLLATANTRIAAEGSLTGLETRSKAAADGKLASQTGDAQLGSGNYAKAAELYRVALQKGGVSAPDINTRLGIALAMTGDKAGAKAAFGAVTGSPNAEIAALWNTYLDAPAPTA